MAEHSKIEWTDATWNPVRGCTRVSPGCGGPGDQGGCYAEAMAARFSQPGQWGHSFAEMRNGKPRWTGRVALIHDKLAEPLTWRRPRRIFVNSTSDLFHEALPPEDIAEVLAYAVASYWHTHQVLTKRPERARELLNDPSFREMVDDFLGAIDPEASELGLYDPLARRTDDWRAMCPDPSETWPIPNLWLGTSVEDQPRADERVPDLLATPATVRFVSAEPMLGAIDLSVWLPCHRGNPLICFPGDPMHICCECANGRGTGSLDWVIVGGESGPNARPMHPDWARSLRDQCQAAGVPFFFKQWGGWAPHKVRPGGDLGGDFRAGRVDIVHPGGESHVTVSHITAGRSTLPGSRYMARVGKSRAGRLLDGREWSEFPEARI